MRGLLHDLGHQMTTLSYLVEAVRGDVELPGDAGFRLELLSLEMSRLLDVIAQEIPGREDAGRGRRGQPALAGRPGDPAGPGRARGRRCSCGPARRSRSMASPVLLWRVLTNVVDNAARAAGPAGRVEVTVAMLAEPHRGRRSRCWTTVPASATGRLEPPRSAWAW